MQSSKKQWGIPILIKAYVVLIFKIVINFTDLLIWYLLNLVFVKLYIWH